MSNREGICWGCVKRDNCKGFNRDRNKVVTECTRYEKSLWADVVLKGGFNNDAYTKYLDELSSYDVSSHKDMPDALAYFLKHLKLYRRMK